MPSVDEGLSYLNQKLTTTDMSFWLWPSRKSYQGTSQTMVSNSTPPHCKVSIRVFMTAEGGKRYVDLVQLHDIQVLDGFLERMPAWVDDDVITRYIDRELRKRFHEFHMVKTNAKVIDKEVSKSRAIQNNHTFIAARRVQPKLERTLAVKKQGRAACA